MKKAALIFAVIGIISGVLFALGPFVMGTPTGSLWSYLAPIIVGLLVIATHRLNLKRLRDSAQRYRRGRLLGFNLALLVFFLAGFAVLYRTGANFPSQPLWMAAFLTLWPLPLAANALYLCTGESAALGS